MTDRTALERFPDTDPADVGCQQAMHLLHVYTDLAACGPCGEDFRGLLAAITQEP